MDQKDIGKEEIMRWAMENNLNISEGQAGELINDNESGDIDIDKWLKENGMSPISEYENISKRLSKKIALIINGLKEEEQKETGEISQETEEREEKESLDEKEGKESLDETKEEQIEEEQKDKEIDPEQESEGKEKPEKEKQSKEDEEKQKTEDEKTELTPKKDSYIANVRKLHEMRIKEYKHEMRNKEAGIDKHFVAMIYLQREINIKREAFIKEYGAEELVAIENENMKEEMKYKKTLNIRMERNLKELKTLEEKLDRIIEEIKIAENKLSKGEIPEEEYNDKIKSLEKDKVECLWEINKLNPVLLSEKNETQMEREDYERRVSPKNIKKEKDLQKDTREKVLDIEKKEEKQQGVAEKTKEDIQKQMKENIDNKEKELEALRSKLKQININSPEGKKEALNTITKIQTLENQKMAQEKQAENIEKNMEKGVKEFSDISGPNKIREEETEDIEKFKEDVDPNDISSELMEQLKSTALKDPETPEQAQKYLDDMQKIGEQADEEQSKDEKEDEGVNEPTLWGKRKRPWN